MVSVFPPKIIPKPRSYETKNGSKKDIPVHSIQANDSVHGENLDKTDEEDNADVSRFLL